MTKQLLNRTVRAGAKELKERVKAIEAALREGRQVEDDELEEVNKLAFAQIQRIMGGAQIASVRAAAGIGRKKR